MSPYSYYPFTANALVLAVSIWLTFRYRRRFFTFWTLGFGFVQLTLVGDLLTMGERTGWGTAYCALTQCTAALFFFFTASSVGPHTKPRGAILTGASLATSLGLILAGVAPAIAFTPPSLALAVAEICLGVRLLRGSPAAPTRWLAVPVLAKGLWILAFPFVTGRPTLEPIGYAIDGMLLVLTGIGMIVYLLELHAGESQLLIDSNRNHAFLMLDPQGRIVRWNSGAERLFGYGAREALFRDWRLLEAPAPAPALEPLLGAAAITPAPEATRRLRRKDGSTFWASLALSPVRSRSGGIEAFALLIGDVSERMRLQEERARLSAAVEQSTDSILIADKTGAIVYANRAFEGRQGAPAAEVFGRPIRSVLEGEAGVELERALAAAEPWRGRHCAAEGRGRVEDLNLAPLHDADGGLVNFVLTLRDVTREATLQNQLRHAQKMEELGKLASNVAHEFGNQLAIIVSYNYLLREAPAPKMLAKCTQAIDRAARRSDMLVRKLLLFTRQDVAKPCVFELNQLLKEVSVVLTQLLGERVVLTTRFAAVPYSVKMDPAQLEQVIFNLATNARDAMPNGGTLALETTLLEVIKGGPEKRERFAVLSVADNGSGMTAEVAANIFQPFYTTKPAGKGTGLGLSIVRTIIEEAGGRIEVISAPGAGSTFRIYLPLQTELPSAAGVALPRATVEGSETILVVEDEESLLESLCFLLEEHGYGALGARSAEEASSLFASHGSEIDLLLSDVILPKTNGRALADKLVRRNPRLRVLFMSAYSDDPLVREEMAQGRFISKPFAAPQLLDAVARALEAPAAAQGRSSG